MTEHLGWTFGRSPGTTDMDQLNSPAIRGSRHQNPGTQGDVTQVASARPPVSR
jgi:hypothetical protein